ncbi:(2Fe-2S)-binding protein, partial [candidate division KSB1 bacterium]|nr:(2Fe-2S)-binding protein [candidate division KSB1 bacterium]
MILIEINNRKISVPVNSTIIQAASRLGITIPTLCFNELYKPFTSCMLCVVLDVKTNRLLPACSTLVQDGMQIDTRCDAVQTARRDALELLFSEHSGDCEAPCQRICPAHMDISQMIREIFAGQMDRAIRTIKKDIPLPGVLGRICSAPCEKGCNRKAFDDSIAICELKRFAADYDLASGNPYVPFCDKDTGNNVAIIGSGPAGLSAAYYLRLYGHQCFVYDKEERPGGQLRYADVPNLPHEVLDSEIQIIRKTGVRFLQNQHIGRDITFDSLQKQYDAIVVAVGEIDLLKNENFGVAMGKRGIDVDSATLKTSEQGVFAAGNAVSPGRMAVRSVGQGHTVALSVHQYLSG